MTEMKSAKLLVEVSWGIIPGSVDGTMQWGFDREEVEASFEEQQFPGDVGAWRKLLHGAYDEFDRRMDPRSTNWVTMTWLWL